MKFLDEKTIESLITWDNSYEATKIALECASNGCAVTGERVFTPIFNTGKWMAPMPGYLNHEKFGAWVCKLLINCPQNATLTKPLPVFNADVYYMDKDTGILQAVMGGVAITSYRTAAASVVATKYIYSDEISQDGKILTILGAGEQGKAHAEAFYHFFNFAEIRIWNRTAGKARKLTELFNEKYEKKIFRFFENHEEAVRGADVIITATNPGAQPLVKYASLKQGAHINAVGVPVSAGSIQELEPEIYKHADIYTDSKNIALKALDIFKDPDVKISAEVGEVIADKSKKTNKGKISIFQSFGIPAQDCAMARMIFDAYNNMTKKLEI